MNHQFDELTKGLAQSVTRRAALKRFGIGLGGMALALLGLANRARGQTLNVCASNKDCAYLGASYVCCDAGAGFKVCAPKSWCSQGGKPPKFP